MKKEEIRKLRIYCLSDISERLNNTRRILQEMERGEIIDINRKGFSTSNTVYIFENCATQENMKGFWADQVIIDNREPMRSIAREMLRGSCVPEQYQIIDDRLLGTSDCNTTKFKGGREDGSRQM